MPPTTAPPQTIGSLIRTRREAAGISQADLGRRARVNIQQLNKYECGHHEPSFAVLARLAAALDCKPRDLVP